MKQLIPLAIVITLMASCNPKKDSPVAEEKDAKPVFILDSLLRYNSEAELIAAFGKENVGRDTAWIPEEGAGYYMVTTLYPASNNQVEFAWTDSATYAGLHFITAQKDSSAWSTRGVKVGTTLKELIKMNGKDFTFSGFGWDFGGEVTWSEGGNLSDLDLTLDISDYDNLPQNEQDSLVMDGSVSSKSELALKYNPFVRKIDLAPKEKK